MMRALTGLVCAWVMCVACAPAQSPRMDDAAPPGNSSLLPVPVPPPTVDLPPAAAPAPGFYVGADFLLFWFKPICLNVPVVSVGNPAAAVPGAVNQPGTQIAVGGSPPYKFEFGATPGVEAKLGWLSADGGFGVETSGFFMATASARQGFVAAPNGAPASYLPYLAPDNSQQALPFTVPGSVTGSSIAVGSTHLWGVESNLFLPVTVDRGGYSLYGALLLGARYLDLTDRDLIDNTLSLVGNPSAFAFGADSSITHNQFAGPQMGAALGLAWGRWSVQYTTKLAAGITHQERSIQGSPLMATSDLSPLLVPGPLIALPSNIGRESANRVTLVPEVGLKARLALTAWCSLSLGYRLIYWDKVLCPGDQMDPLVNITQLPFHGPMTGPRDPSPQFVHTDFFAQGIDAGILFRF
jgi:hypothetical protein